MRLPYGGTPADFVVSPGALADVVDEAGNPVPSDPQDPESPPLQGWAALLPSFSGSFDVYDGVGGTQLTDLLDESGSPVTSVSFDGSFDDTGQLPRFEGPDGYEGDVYLSTDGSRWVRVAPSADSLFSRVGAVEDAVDGLVTTDLDDVSATAPTDGQMLTWDNANGVWQPTDPSETVAGVASVNGETGTVELDASDVGAAAASHNHSGGDITSGTVDVGRLPVGTNAWQVAAGNHSHAIGGVSGLQDALDSKVNTADVARVWPVIGAEDPTPVGAVEGDIIVRRQA